MTSTSSFWSVSSAVVDKLKPYFGLSGNLAACSAIECPLTLTYNETNALTKAVTDGLVGSLRQWYLENKKEGAETLSRGIRTAIVSVWSEFIWLAYPKFWRFVAKNDWNNAVKEFRNFYTNPKGQKPADLKRSNDEADIIEAALMKCNRSVDLVFLLEVTPSAVLEESLNFVTNITKTFSDDKSTGADGTRFGLSTFSNTYKSEFHLSSYTNQSDYLSAVNHISKRGKVSFLGGALTQILTDQFNETQDPRPEVRGFPRILIVLTRSRSIDDVSTPARKIREKNIAVYAIGIGNYNLDQRNCFFRIACLQGLCVFRTREIYFDHNGVDVPRTSSHFPQRDNNNKSCKARVSVFLLQS